MFVVSYENRPAESIGLRALALSLERHAPGLVLLVPDRDLPARSRDWLGRRPNVELFPMDGPMAEGWAVKADVIAAAMAHAGGRVTWMDADIVAAADPRGLLRPSGDELIVAEEHWMLRRLDADAYRATWGLATGRALHARANSSVVGVGPGHAALLGRWRALLRDPIYLESQRRHFDARPPGAQSDQEVLTALLCSSEFADLPLRWLRAGRDIAHCMANVGWSASERLACRFGLPPLVHAVGSKPWTTRPQPLATQVSPYTELIGRMRDALGDPGEVILPPRRGVSRLLRALAAGDPVMQGLLPAALDELRIRLRLGGRLRRLAALLPGRRGALPGHWH